MWRVSHGCSNWHALDRSWNSQCQSYMLKDIPVNKFFPWSIRNPCTSLSHRRTNFLPSELQCSHRRPKAASPSENPNDSSHFWGLTESTLAPETEPAAGALTAVTEYGAQWGRGVTYHYNGSWWGEPPSSAPHVYTVWCTVRQGCYLPL